MPTLSIVWEWNSEKELQQALDACTALNVTQLRARPLPPLYSTGIRYQRDVCAAPHVPGACERFVTAHQAYKEFRDGLRLGCDCDDLACWRAAELQLKGKIARAKARRSSIGYHVVVVHGSGRIEDPSKRLGMKGTA